MKSKPTAYNLPARADLVTSLGYSGVHVNPQHYSGVPASVNLSGTIYQAYVFWNSSSQLVIATRVLDGSWTQYAQAAITIPGDDNHDSIAIGLDPNGYIHVCYAMHVDALHYRTSDVPIDSWTGTLTTTLSMVGTNESAVTYPFFFNDPAGNLYFLFRDGGSGNGDLYMYKYTHGTTTWAAAAGTGTGGKLIDGKSESPDRSPYWEHPVFDADFGSGGYMHLPFRWRVTGDADGANRDLNYVKWNGTNWYHADGTAQTVPITSANCEVVDNTSGANLGLTSGHAIYSDSNGNPHIVYPKTHTDGYRHLFHAYHDGASWTITQLTAENNPNLGDNSTYLLGLIPSIAIDRATDTIYVLYINPINGDGIQLLKSTDGTTWTHKTVYPYSVGWWSPKFDYVEFERSGNLYLPVEEYYGALLAGSQPAFPIYFWKVDPATL